ncbi:MAG: vitamin K epoxide reductase family protein [Candidatus Micrarchaeia archaeon]
MEKIKLRSVKGAMLILSIIGLTVSIYLSIYHMLGIPLLCSTSGLINCSNVINSPFGYIAGIPVADFGVAFFVIEIGVLLFISDPFAKIFINTIGLGFVFYFLYAEYTVGNICEYCTSVHIIVILLLILSIYLFKKDKDSKRHIT